MTSKLSILTRPSGIFSKERLKYELATLAQALGGRTRGPQSVAQSLLRGLKGAGIPYSFNPSHKDITNVIHILSGTGALRESLTLKKKDATRKLIVGPNVVVLPTDFKNLIADPLIDIILVPSEWVAEVYKKVRPDISAKVRIWPSGVKIPDEKRIMNTAGKKKYIVFKKDVPQELFETVITELNRRELPYEVLTYGTFSKDKYLTALSSANALIYLQRVESQGLALQEAWSYDVPTFVWNTGEFTYPDTDITATGKVSAPYLTNESGMFFKDAPDFLTSLPVFIEKISKGEFQPRNYCAANLSDEASAAEYIKILKEIGML